MTTPFGHLPSEIRSVVKRQLSQGDQETSEEKTEG